MDAVASAIQSGDFTPLVCQLEAAELSVSLQCPSSASMEFAAQS